MRFNNPSVFLIGFVDELMEDGHLIMENEKPGRQLRSPGLNNDTERTENVALRMSVEPENARPYRNTVSFFVCTRFPDCRR